MFSTIKKKVSDKYQELSGETLFVVDTDREIIWDQYLSGFDESVRQEYNCNCCKSFIRQWGGIVAIKNNKLVSIWDVVNISEEYAVPIKNLSDYIHSLKIKDVFIADTQKLGTDFNFDKEKNIKWEHFSLVVDRRYVKSATAIDTEKAKLRDNKSVLKRSLDELSLDAADVVIDLIKQGSLYRGTEFLGMVEAFKKLKLEYSKIPANEKDNFCWVKSGEAPTITRIRNTAIGTLLIDLSEGKEVDKAVTAFERVVAPTNYKRPTALVTASMIESAKKRIQELGLEGALNRRFARETDVNVEDVLFVDKSSAITDVFGELKKDVIVNPRSFNKIEEVGIEQFIKNVLPTAKSVYVMLENEHLNTLVSLIAPVEESVNQLFKWNNNFSWSYTNGLTDSIKEKVKQAGGNVNGELRVSLSWHNYDDLDLHVIEPKPGQHIYYGANRSLRTGGTLDVDMNAHFGKSRNAVENIIWTDKSKMVDGVYEVQVNQFSKRETIDVGYTVEIECRGEVFTFDSALSPKSTDSVVKFTYTRDGGISLQSAQKSTVTSKEKWGVKTNQFTKVKMMSLSPNHWNGQIGNKHYIFILEGCVSDESPRPFFNEFLKEELSKDRKVFEVLGGKLKVADDPHQLSGVGFSETQRNSLIVKVEGNITRTLKIKF